LTPSPFRRVEGLSATATQNVAAGFSPQAVQEFFAEATALKNRLIALLDKRAIPSRPYEAVTPNPLPNGEEVKPIPLSLNLAPRLYTSVR
jgi:hypothetical protein